MINRKSGAIMVMTALLSTAILGITAIVVDIGYLYYKKNDLQTAVNAGWLAGNDRLMKLRTANPILSKENKEEIKSHILEVMSYNGFNTDADNEIYFSIENDRDISLEAQSHVGLFFAKAIKADSTTISANRDANTATTKAADVLPIAMSHGVIKWNADSTLSFQFFPQGKGFVEGNEYIIKPGQQSDASLLCQGITSFGTNIDGANYQKTLSYGYTRALNINDQLTLACTGFTNETNSAIATRNGNKRVIIPIVEPTAEIATNYGVKAEQLPIYSLKSKDVTTDAHKIFTIENASRIIGFAEFELLAASEYKRIGNDYQNGDAGTLGKPASGQLRGKFLGYIVNPNEVTNNK